MLATIVCSNININGGYYLSTLKLSFSSKVMGMKGIPCKEWKSSAFSVELIVMLGADCVDGNILTPKPLSKVYRHAARSIILINFSANASSNEVWLLLLCWVRFASVTTERIDCYTSACSWAV